MQSLIVDLAFQRAAANKQTGQSLSNKDVDRMLMSIGASASNPEAFKAVLAENARSVYDAFNNMHITYNGQPYANPAEILGPFASVVPGAVQGLTPEEQEELKLLEEQVGGQ
jgi:hypothetical protein